MECCDNESQSNMLSLDICRCCLSRNCNVFQSSYSSENSNEHYLVLLSDTFGIQLNMQQEYPSQNVTVCDKCIVQIRAASDFKKQVLDAENDFLKYLHHQSTESAASLPRASPPPRPPEPAPSPPDPDDLPLRQLQLQRDFSPEVKLEFVEAEPTERKIKKIKKRERTLKGTTSSIEAETKPSKDWAKLAERRGAGPILRANSLILLQHSTLTVFQWHCSRYRCFCCQHPYSDIAALRHHTSTEHDIRSIEKKIILQQNRLVKVEVSTLSCNICGENVDNIDSLATHLSREHGIQLNGSDHLLVPFVLRDGPLECQICSEKFTMFRLLNIHLNRHYQNHVCHVCGAAFSNLVFLNLHRTRTHRVAKCALCHKEFPSCREMRSHERNKHGVKRARKLRFPCTYCDERFYQENMKVQHLIERHGMPRPQYKCDACPKVFITRSLRNSHAKHVHFKQRTRECETCHMRFYSMSDVNRHRVTHTGEKNFLCHVCQSAFASRDSLRRHSRRVHAGL